MNEPMLACSYNNVHTSFIGMYLSIWLGQIFVLNLFDRLLNKKEVNIYLVAKLAQLVQGVCHCMICSIISWFLYVSSIHSFEVQVLRGEEIERKGQKQRLLKGDGKKRRESTKLAKALFKIVCTFYFNQDTLFNSSSIRTQCSTPRYQVQIPALKDSLSSMMKAHILGDRVRGENKKCGLCLYYIGFLFQLQWYQSLVFHPRGIKFISLHRKIRHGLCGSLM